MSEKSFEECAAPEITTESRVASTARTRPGGIFSVSNAGVSRKSPDFEAATRRYAPGLISSYGSARRFTHRKVTAGTLERAKNAF